MDSTEVGVVYRVTCDASPAFLGAMPTTPVSKQTVQGFGGKLGMLIATWYLDYTNGRPDVASCKDQADCVGAKAPISGVLSFIDIVQYDWMKHLDASGKRLTTVDVFNYVFSGRIDVYAEVDYTRLQGTWVALNSVTAFNNSGNTYSDSSQLSVMLGVQHKFRLFGLFLQ